MTERPLGFSVSTEKDDGSESDGGVVSVNVNVTSKPVVPGFPWLSVAVHDTCVVPTGNRLPDVGEQLAVTGPSTRSLPTTLGQLTVLPDGLEAGSVMLGGGD